MRGSGQRIIILAGTIVKVVLLTDRLFGREKNVVCSSDFFCGRWICKRRTCSVWWRWSFWFATSFTTAFSSSRRRRNEPKWRRRWRSAGWRGRRQERVKREAESKEIAEAQARRNQVEKYTKMNKENRLTRHQVLCNSVNRSAHREIAIDQDRILTGLSDYFIWPTLL